MTTITIKHPLLGHTKNRSFSFRFAAISWLLVSGYLPTSNPNKYYDPKSGRVARLHKRKKQ